MPIDQVPQLVPMMPHQVNVPLPDGAGMFISVSVQSDGTATPEAMDTALQSLVDYLQEWPGRREDANVTGTKYDTLMYGVQPTDPIPLPDPPGEEPDPPLSE